MPYNHYSLFIESPGKSFFFQELTVLENVSAPLYSGCDGGCCAKLLNLLKNLMAALAL